MLKCKKIDIELVEIIEEMFLDSIDTDKMTLGNVIGEFKDGKFTIDGFEYQESKIVDGRYVETVVGDGELGNGNKIGSFYNISSEHRKKYGDSWPHKSDLKTCKYLLEYAENTNDMLLVIITDTKDIEFYHMSI